jgi:hypothetical protein
MSSSDAPIVNRVFGFIVETQTIDHIVLSGNFVRYEELIAESKVVRKKPENPHKSVLSGGRYGALFMNLVEILVGYPDRTYGHQTSEKSDLFFVINCNQGHKQIFDSIITAMQNKEIDNLNFFRLIGSACWGVARCDRVDIIEKMLVASACTFDQVFDASCAIKYARYGSIKFLKKLCDTHSLVIADYYNILRAFEAGRHWNAYRQFVEYMLEKGIIDTDETKRIFDRIIEWYDVDF